MKLQYQLSNGNWTDCGDRTDEFLSLCAKYGGGQEKSLSDLAAGRSVRNDGSDWYSNCRDFEVIEKIQAQHLANQPPSYSYRHSSQGMNYRGWPTLPMCAG